MALSKTGRFLSKAEILGVGVFSPLPKYTSNLYGSTPPICIAVLSWLLSFEERETLQYASHMYCSTPPICTAARPPFVRQYFWKNTGGWGHRNVSEFPLSGTPVVQSKWA